jgi:serine/threonine protein kinase
MPARSALATFPQMVHSGWAAPELGLQPRSMQSDIFSFACTIYEVLVYYFLDLWSLFTYSCALDVYPTTPL